MTWIKMADQKPPVGVDMLALRETALGSPRFSSGLFVERSSDDESYLVFALPRASGTWDTDDVTHWALVELPE